MIIDFHTHIFPDKIAEKTIEVLSNAASLPPHTDGTLAGLRRSMSESGIDYSVVLPIATKPSQAATINSFSAEITGKGGIISFGSIHPFSDNWKAELDNVSALGLKGIKLHPEYQGFFIDDEKIYPVIEYAKKLGLIVIFHSGVDLGFTCEVRCTPERIRKMLDKIGGGRLVFAHGGGFQCWKEVSEYLAGQDIYFDLSFTKGSLTDEKLLRLIRIHGVEKWLFGTDSPWSSQFEYVNAIKSLKLNDDELFRIMYKNAPELLNMGE